MADPVETPVASAATPSTPPEAPAPQPVVSSAEPNPSDYLARIQENAAKFERESQSAEAPSAPEVGSTSPAPDTQLDPAAEASAYKEAEEPKAEEPVAEAPVEEAAPAPETPEPTVEVKDGESIRQVIKRSNLPTDLKETITNLAFKAEAYDKIGFSVEQARQLKELGVTPEAVAARVGIHASVEDEARDAQLAISMRQLGADLTQNPAAFVDGMISASPDIAQRLITAAVERAELVAPELLVRSHENAIWQALNAAYQDPEHQGDDAKLEAIRNVAAMFFPDGAPSAAPSPAPDNDLANSADPIHREYARLKAEREAFAAEQRRSFATTMFESGKNAVFQATKAAWEEVKPSSMPQAVSDKVVKEIFEQVGTALLSSEAIKRDMEGFLSGRLDNEQFQRAVGWLLERAKPNILLKRKAALDFWSPTFPATGGKPAPAPAATRPAAPAPAKPDVGRASSAPAPSRTVDIKAQVMAEMRKNHWDYQRTMQEYQARMKTVSR